VKYNKKITSFQKMDILTGICRYYETYPDAFDNATANTALAGLGIGLLATAAVSLASSVAELSITGAQVVRQAFRLGILVNEVSQNLEAPDLADDSSPDTWAYVIANVSADEVQKELDLLQAKEVSCVLNVYSWAFQYLIGYTESP
jgi:monodictyphenone polyketide synthase